MKYLVMETRLSHAIVLDSEGRVITVANMGYTSGQTLDWVVPMTRERFAKSSRSKFILIGLAAVFAVFVCVWGTIRFLSAPYATFYLSGEVSFIVTVDRQHRVQTIKPLEDDAEDLLKGYSYKGRQVDAVLTDILYRAVSEEEIEDDDELMIDIDASDLEWVQQQSEKLAESIRQNWSGEASVLVTIRSYQDSEQLMQIELQGIKWQNHKEDDN